MEWWLWVLMAGWVPAAFRALQEGSIGLGILVLFAWPIAALYGYWLLASGLREMLGNRQHDDAAKPRT